MTCRGPSAAIARRGASAPHFDKSRALLAASTLMRQKTDPGCSYGYDAWTGRCRIAGGVLPFKLWLRGDGNFPVNRRSRR